MDFLDNLDNVNNVDEEERTEDLERNTLNTLKPSAEELEKAVLNLVNSGLDVVAACKSVGMVGVEAERFAIDLMKKDGFIKGVEDAVQRDDLLIRSKKQRQRFWGNLMSDESVDPRSRLKASELLAKSESDFVDTLNVTFSPEILLKRIEEEFVSDKASKADKVNKADGGNE